MAGFRLSLNAMGVEQGKRDVLQAFNQIKSEANKTASAIDTLGRKSINPMKSMSTAIDNVGGKSKNLGLVINQMANQVGDFAVQVSMGTSAIKALGMQAPQAAGALSMLSGPFVGIATAIGLVAAIGLPLIGMLTSMGNEGATTADKLDALADQIERLEALNQKAGDSVVDLSRDYGVLAERVRDAAKAVSELEAAEAGRQARQTTADIAATYGGLNDIAATIEELKNAQTLDFSNAANAFLNLQQDLALGADEAALVAEGLIAINDAATDEERAKALLAFTETLTQVKPQTEAGAAATVELARQAQSAGDQFARIVTLANQAAQNVTYLLSGDTAARMNRWANRGGTSDRQFMTNFGLENTNDNRPVRSGGKSALEREQDELKRFADGIKPVISLLEEYEQNITKLNRAKEIGAITAEEFAVKEAILTQEFGIASGALMDYTSVANNFANSLESGLMAMVDGTMSVQDAFKSMAASVIKELYRVMVVQQMVNSIMGVFGYTQGASGGFIKAPAVPSMDGGGYTGDGARTGGLDGKGGFLTMLHPQETVVDHTKGQSGGVVVNQTINVSAGVSQTVRAEMMNMLPQFKQQATQGVLDAKRRGGSYGGAFA